MVKLGEEYEDKKEKKERNKLKDFGNFLEDYWWTLLIAVWLLFSGIESIIKAGQPQLPKEKAVVVEDVTGVHDYKVRYLNDGAVQVVDLDDDAYVVGDTVLVER